MQYLGKTITASATITAQDYEQSDYAQLFSDNQTGVMDYDDPLVERTRNMFVKGWGHFAWGAAAWTDRSLTLSLSAWITSLGLWEFAVLTFDSLGNTTTTGVDTDQYYVCLVPQTPTAPGLMAQTAGPTFTLNR